MADNRLIPLSQAVEAIKTAILQGQYEANKDVNRIQLAVYFGIGKYLSKNSDRFVYGAAMMAKISEQLRKDLPGLRGFSKSMLYEMRRFYDIWNMLDADFPIEIGKSPQQSIVSAKCTQDSCVATHYLSAKESEVETSENPNFPITIGKLQANENIDIYHSIVIPNVAEFPVEDFFNVPFTHHIRIMTMCKDIEARYYYIHRTAEEKMSVEALEKLIRQQTYENRDNLPNNFIQTIPNLSMARKAVMMFKDSYALDFINTEEIGLRDNLYHRRRYAGTIPQSTARHGGTETAVVERKRNGYIKRHPIV